MSPFQAAVLGAVQGLTEFLPISSSAHLYIVPTVLGWPYAGVAFDVALHWGTVAALLFAFRRDWWNLIRSAFAADSVQRGEAHSTWLKLGVASVPAGVAGLILGDKASAWTHSLPLQAALLFVFGLLLWLVDRQSPSEFDTPIPKWSTVLFVGAAQALALVPGVSRSGVTITAGRAARLTRVAAARFSFLMATPITMAAGVLEARHLSDSIPLSTLAVGVISSAVVGTLAIHGLIRWLSRAGLGAFFAYRAALAIVIVLGSWG